MYNIYIYTYNTYTYIYIYNKNVIFIRGHINPRRFLRLQERVDAGCHRGGTGAVAHRLRGPVARSFLGDATTRHHQWLMMVNMVNI